MGALQARRAQRVHAPSLHDAGAEDVRRDPQPLSWRPRVQVDGRPLHRRVRAAVERGLGGRAGPGDGAQLSHLGYRQGLHHAGTRGRALRVTVRGVGWVSAKRVTHQCGRRGGGLRSLALANPPYGCAASDRALFFFARIRHRGAMGLSLQVRTERWPIAGSFTISRGAKMEADVVVAEVSDGTHIGRGECVPYARYGETVAGVTAALEAMRAPLARGLNRQALQDAMPAGAARNALDCALWDYEAKAKSEPAHVLAGMPRPHACVTAYTISLGTPGTMGDAARKAAERKLLKIKLGGEGDPERI